MPSKLDFNLEESADVLSRTPGVLKAMLSSLPEHWTSNNYGADTFSPFDVVGHLIHGDQTDWITRTRQILETQDTEPFVPFDRYAMYEKSQGKTIAELLDEFEQVRSEALDDLTNLGITGAQLELTGKHPVLGSVKLRELLATWVAHDLNHIHQVAKCMAHQYKDAIGPWVGHLGVFPKQT
ncbi:MAG: hypothetical protein DHS20C16_00550 [Phycisphaerae bacterium]|nr:MAG: hypothetical protein DHS20C16_00550 [Phycisphaerae bacterium]